MDFRCPNCSRPMSWKEKFLASLKNFVCPKCKEKLTTSRFYDFFGLFVGGVVATPLLLWALIFTSVKVGIAAFLVFLLIIILAVIFPNRIVGPRQQTGKSN